MTTNKMNEVKLLDQAHVNCCCSRGWLFNLKTLIIKIIKTMDNKKCIGFILLKEYPNCNKRVGEFERFTTGEFLNYPEIWKPVYEEIKCKCRCEIKIGCLVRYNDEAKKHIASVIGYGNPSGRVTKIEERNDAEPLVFWGIKNCCDITWLEHC